jgi:CRISPR-associated protein Csm2
MSAYHQQSTRANRSSQQDEVMQVKDKIIRNIGDLPMANFTPDKFAERDSLAEQFIKALFTRDRKAKDALNPTQLRKVFHQVKKLQQQFHKKREEETLPRTDIALLSAQLAYASGRKLIPNEFFEVVTYCLDGRRCKTKADFDNVARFLEALMAYHKYYSEYFRSEQGGQDD